ncbi:hypothetical protein N7541_000704 [Penicillium brevicompactum]|uniref:Uncharacterized protein n=1 Tax=Penicillium brevicompactum TaxID=5074 RepID=A0A9W9RZG4_PENBR|nr:hypothetical protein N7541_000704 [Penicillium brevicompactum]
MGFFSRQSGSKSERAPEAPEYNVRLAEYEAKHKPSYYGPNFHRGPEQEEIFDRRRNGEKFPRDHPELRNRAHSYDTTDKHKVSDPYETRPLPWKNQVQADYDRYKYLGHKDRFEPVEEIISRGNNIQFGRNRKPSEQDQRAIHNASVAASKASRMANL